jgi:HEAT repeat protein
VRSPMVRYLLVILGASLLTLAISIGVFGWPTSLAGLITLVVAIFLGVIATLNHFLGGFHHFIQQFTKRVADTHVATEAGHRARPTEVLAFVVDQSPERLREVERAYASSIASAIWPGFERDKFVPPRVTIAARPTPSEFWKQLEHDLEVQAPDFAQRPQGHVDLPGLFEQYPRLVLLGEGGVGKSTVMRYVAQSVAEACLRKPSTVLPLLIPLSEYEDKRQRAEDFLKEHFRRIAGSASPLLPYFEDYLRRGRFLVLLDGLDQMPGRSFEHRGIATAEVRTRIDPREESIMALAEAGESGFVLSCREYAFVPSRGWQEIQLLPFGHIEIDSFIQKYLSGQKAKWLCGLLDHDEGIADIARNPFFLRVLAEIVDHGREDIPSNKGRLLEMLIQERLRWEQDERKKELSPERIWRGLSVLAFEMTRRGSSEVDEGWALRRMGAANRSLLDQGEATGLVIRVGSARRPRIAFPHLLFQAVFAAAKLRSMNFLQLRILWLLKARDRWAPVVKARDRWIQPIAMLAGIHRNPERIIDAVLRGLGARILFFFPDVFTRETAISILGETRNPRVVAPLIDCYQRWTSDILVPKWKILEALGKVGDEQATRFLACLLLETKDFVEGTAAAEALGEAANDLAVEPLTALLLREDPFLAMSTLTESLLRIGPRAVPHLVRSLVELPSPPAGFPPGRIWSIPAANLCRVLGGLGAPSVRALLDAAKDFPDSERSIALAISDVVDSEAVDGLVEGLANEAPEIREASAQALERIGDPGTIKPLLDRLEDDDSRVRMAAAFALGSFGPLAADSLIPLLADGDSSKRRGVIRALGLIRDPRAYDPLRQILWDEDLFVAVEAAYAVRLIDPAGSKDEIQRALGDKAVAIMISLIATATSSKGTTEDVNGLSPSHQRAAFIELLGKLGEARALGVLRDCLSDEDAEVRGYAAVAIGRIGGPEAAEILVEGLYDSDAGVIMASQRYLEEIGVPAIPFLLAAAKDRGGGSAVWTLKHLGGAATEALIELLRVPDRDLVWQAVVGLGEVGDERRSVPALLELARETAKTEETISVQARASIMRIWLGRQKEGASVPVPTLEEVEQGFKARMEDRRLGT